MKKTPSEKQLQPLGHMTQEPVQLDSQNFRSAQARNACNVTQLVQFHANNAT